MSCFQPQYNLLDCLLLFSAKCIPQNTCSHLVPTLLLALNSLPAHPRSANPLPMDLSLGLTHGRPCSLLSQVKWLPEHRAPVPSLPTWNLASWTQPSVQISPAEDGGGREGGGQPPSQTQGTSCAHCRSPSLLPFVQLSGSGVRTLWSPGPHLCAPTVTPQTGHI